MKVSENWLRSIVNPPKKIEEIANDLTAIGVEVDSIEREASPFANKEDTVLTLKIPANRGDLLSMEGVMREITALYHMPFPSKQLENLVPNISVVFPSHIHEFKECPRYVGRVIQNINSTIATPEWLVERLHYAGIRSISPVVDVTNYVMLELGQPLHAFDLAKLSNEIQVRFAKPKEKITTLEGAEIELTEDTLVIADSKKPQAIAGVIGGQDSAVSEKTRDIFLESAYFDPIQIRTTAKRFGLRTDSSIRFERGIDPDLQIRALDRATQLIVEILGGNVAPMVEKCDEAYIPDKTVITLRNKRIEQILGITIPAPEIQNILDRLGFQTMIITYHENLAHSNQSLNPKVINAGPIVFQVTVPNFRVDIVAEEDLIEELIRMIGYHKIVAESPLAPLSFVNAQKCKTLLQEMKQILLARGYFEAINYSFIAKEFAELFLSSDNSDSSDPMEIEQKDSFLLELSNPISMDMNVMRTSLIPGLIRNILYNQNRQQNRFRFFETGAVFLQRDHKLTERNKLAGVSGGALFKEQWGIKSLPADFYDMKGDLEALFKASHLSDFQFRKSHVSWLHPGQSAEILLNKKSIGYLGALHPKLLKTLDLTEPLFVFELDIESLMTKIKPRFKEISKYPAIRRDLAIIVNKDVLADELKKVVIESSGELLQEVSIFDIYQGPGIDQGSKSVALGLILQHGSHTLVDNEVTAVVDRVLENLRQQFHAVLRE